MHFLCCDLSSLLRQKAMMVDKDFGEFIDGDAGQSFKSREYKSIPNICACFCVGGFSHSVMGNIINLLPDSREEHTRNRKRSSFFLPCSPRTLS